MPFEDESKVDQPGSKVTAIPNPFCNRNLGNDRTAVLTSLLRLFNGSDRDREQTQKDAYLLGEVLQNENTTNPFPSSSARVLQLQQAFLSGNTEALEALTQGQDEASPVIQINRADWVEFLNQAGVINEGRKIVFDFDGVVDHGLMEYSQLPDKKYKFDGIPVGTSDYSDPKNRSKLFENYIKQHINQIPNPNSTCATELGLHEDGKLKLARYLNAAIQGRGKTILFDDLNDILDANLHFLNALSRITPLIKDDILLIQVNSFTGESRPYRSQTDQTSDEEQSKPIATFDEFKEHFQIDMSNIRNADEHDCVRALWAIFLGHKAGMYLNTLDDKATHPSIIKAPHQPTGAYPYPFDASEHEASTSFVSIISSFFKFYEINYYEGTRKSDVPAYCIEQLNDAIKNLKLFSQGLDYQRTQAFDFLLLATCASAAYKTQMAFTNNSLIQRSPADELMLFASCIRELRLNNIELSNQNQTEQSINKLWSEEKNGAIHEIIEAIIKEDSYKNQFTGQYDPRITCSAQRWLAMHKIHSRLGTPQPVSLDSNRYPNVSLCNTIITSAVIDRPETTSELEKDLVDIADKMGAQSLKWVFPFKHDYKDTTNYTDEVRHIKGEENKNITIQEVPIWLSGLLIRDLDILKNNKCLGCFQVSDNEKETRKSFFQFIFRKSLWHETTGQHDVNTQKLRYLNIPDDPTLLLSAQALMLLNDTLNGHIAEEHNAFFSKLEKLLNLDPNHGDVFEKAQVYWIYTLVTYALSSNTIVTLPDSKNYNKHILEKCFALFTSTMRYKLNAVIEPTKVRGFVDTLVINIAQCLENIKDITQFNFHKIHMDEIIAPLMPKTDENSLSVFQPPSSNDSGINLTSIPFTQDGVKHLQSLYLTALQGGLYNQMRYIHRDSKDTLEPYESPIKNAIRNLAQCIRSSHTDDTLQNKKFIQCIMELFWLEVCSTPSHLYPEYMSTEASEKKLSESDLRDEEEGSIPHWNNHDENNTHLTMSDDNDETPSAGYYGEDASSSEEEEDYPTKPSFEENKGSRFSPYSEEGKSLSSSNDFKGNNDNSFSSSQAEEDQEPTYLNVYDQLHNEYFNNHLSPLWDRLFHEGTLTQWDIKKIRDSISSFIDNGWSDEPCASLQTKKLLYATLLHMKDYLKNHFKVPNEGLDYSHRADLQVYLNQDDRKSPERVSLSLSKRRGSSQLRLSDKKIRELVNRLAGRSTAPYEPCTQALQLISRTLSLLIACVNIGYLYTGLYVAPVSNATAFNITSASPLTTAYRNTLLTTAFPEYEKILSDEMEILLSYVVCAASIALALEFYAQKSGQFSLLRNKNYQLIVSIVNILLYTFEISVGFYFIGKESVTSILGTALLIQGFSEIAVPLVSDTKQLSLILTYMLSPIIEWIFRAPLEIMMLSNCYKFDSDDHEYHKNLKRHALRVVVESILYTSIFSWGIFLAAYFISLPIANVFSWSNENFQWKPGETIEDTIISTACAIGYVITPIMLLNQSLTQSKIGTGLLLLWGLSGLLTTCVITIDISHVLYYRTNQSILPEEWEEYVSENISSFILFPYFLSAILIAVERVLKENQHSAGNLNPIYVDSDDSSTKNCQSKIKEIAQKWRSHSLFCECNQKKEKKENKPVTGSIAEYVPLGENTI